MANDSHIERLAGRLRAAGIRSDDAFVRAYGRAPGKRERRALAMATHSKSAPNSMVQSHARRSARFHANTVFKTARPDLPRVPLNMAQIRADEIRAGVANERDANSIHRFKKMASGEKPRAFGKDAVLYRQGVQFSGRAKNITAPRSIDFDRELAEKFKARD